jgi:hypothetical protein
MRIHGNMRPMPTPNHRPSLPRWRQALQGSTVLDGSAILSFQLCSYSSLASCPNHAAFQIRLVWPTLPSHFSTLLYVTHSVCCLQLPLLGALPGALLRPLARPRPPPPLTATSSLEAARRRPLPQAHSSSTTLRPPCSTKVSKVARHRAWACR